VPASKHIASLVLAACAVLSIRAAAAETYCQTTSFEGQGYAACTYAPDDAARLETFSLDPAGEPYRYFLRLQQELAGEDKTLVFAMNAGMFDDSQKPIGLYVEDGKQSKKLNRRNGAGNFHMKPNGVFFIRDGKPRVMETEAFAKLGVKPEFASQSGPMLVINGAIHPKISESGTSRKLRNGVGIDAAGQAIFVISDGAVTFYEFAKFFRDGLRTRNALFFDGTISGLYSKELQRNDGFLPLGPMVGAYKTQ
jgi:uncharacterized protein YigE (DUF2233 family)